MFLHLCHPERNRRAPQPTISMKNLLLLLSLSILFVLPGCDSNDNPEPTNCKISKVTFQGWDYSILYNYDSDDRLIKITLIDNGDTSISTLTYNGNAVVFNGYNENGVLTSIKNATLTPTGNIIDVTETDTSGNIGRTIHLSYNSDNNLIEVIENDNGNIDTTTLNWVSGNLTVFTNNISTANYDYYTGTVSSIRYGKGNGVLLNADITVYVAPLSSKDFIKTIDLGVLNQDNYSYEYDEWGKATKIIITSNGGNNTDNIEYDCD